MKKILVVSATSKTNLNLAIDINNLCQELDAESTVISLEDFMLPLYTDKVYDKEKDNYIETVKIKVDE